ncbi:hypothetical protein Pmani_031034 [Petrolisthes manimaculis]|uniref:Uncharacterized protein n=1 Tax=Petrolisthes manimaculis TaxID=1843537 RepID=A0AAE1NUP6_9EUCA|nr:hypothetical protein Pmani_031034 [Petrolisthes manimaculis]
MKCSVLVVGTGCVVTGEARRDKGVANYEVEDVEVNVQVENNTTVSTLTLADAQVYNSGTYTCSPANAKPASIRVHVLSGEYIGVGLED